MNGTQERAIKAITFDFDGTLVDSAPDLQSAMNRVLVWAGRDTLSIEAVKGMVGDGVQKLVERGLEATGGIPDADSVETVAYWVSRFLDEYKDHDADLTHAYAGVHATLERLKADGYRLAVCTNKPQAATIDILEALDLSGFFDAVLGGDVLEGIRKPDPKHLLATLSAMDLTPAEAIMVGDHLNDLACARAAGAPAILCSYGYSRVPVDELGADAVIDRFEDLPAVIEGLS